jgi:hypothetical protein
MSRTITPTSILIGDGRYYDFRNPSLDGVDVRFLARAISRICRFTGHCDRFYSVAEHSVWVSHLVPSHLARQALVHDLHEALVGDVSSPLKGVIGAEYKRLEQEAWALVADLCGVPVTVDPLVKRADLVMLGVERRKILANDSGEPWDILRGIPDVVDEYPGLELGKSSDEAFDFFMNRYEALPAQPQDALKVCPRFVASVAP